MLFISPSRPGKKHAFPPTEKSMLIRRNKSMLFIYRVGRRPAVALVVSMLFIGRPTPNKHAYYPRPPGRASRPPARPGIFGRPAPGRKLLLAGHDASRAAQFRDHTGDSERRNTKPFVRAWRGFLGSPFRPRDGGFLGSPPAAGPPARPGIFGRPRPLPHSVCKGFLEGIFGRPPPAASDFWTPPPVGAHIHIFSHKQVTQVCPKRPGAPGPPGAPPSLSPPSPPGAPH